MSAGIRKAAVIGAGTMGSGIAAQFANAGVPVVLLDMAPEGAADRRAFAKGGIDRQLKAGGFMHPAAAGLVTPANVDDELDLVADADWIVEAIIEDLGAKQALFRRLEAVRKAGSIVSSNTSTLSRAALIDGLPESFGRDFAITHFFNPVRFMALLEVVEAAGTRVAEAGEEVLGKTIIACRDTPGFIANRLGCYWMAMAAVEAKAHGLTVEEADKVAGAPFGVPRTGVFGLFDLVGIDLVPLVWGSLMRTLPADDGLHAYDITRDATFTGMIAAGRLGKKSKAGFYRASAADRKKKEVVDLATLDYRPESKDVPEALVAAGDDLRALCEGDGPASRYAWTVLKRILGYACAVAPEIADDVAAIDTGLQQGYAWRGGPFALADSVGVRWIAERLAAEGETVPALLAAAVKAGGFYAEGGKVMIGTDGQRRSRVRPAGVLSLAEIKDAGKPVLETASAALWDIGEGIACLELKTKMNIFDDGVFDLIDQSVETVAGGFRGLVVGNEHPRAFSAGASLEVMLKRIDTQDFTGLRAFVGRGQASFRALKDAPFPVVGAAFGLALGGGCESLLHCDAVVAHAELNAGLPETNLGLVPAWGGCTRLLARAAASGRGPKGPVAVATRVFDVIAAGTVVSSAALARDIGILRDGDVIVMSRQRLLAAARAKAIDLSKDYTAPEPAELVLSGATGMASLANAIYGERLAGRITEADAAIRTVLARVLTGGESDPVLPVPEDKVYALELEALVDLAGTKATRERIHHMLTVGKPLRN